MKKGRVKTEDMLIRVETFCEELKKRDMSIRDIMEFMDMTYSQVKNLVICASSSPESQLFEYSRKLVHNNEETVYGWLNNHWED